MPRSKAKYCSETCRWCRLKGVRIGGWQRTAEAVWREPALLADLADLRLPQIVRAHQVVLAAQQAHGRVCLPDVGHHGQAELVRVRVRVRVGLG